MTFPLIGCLLDERTIIIVGEGVIESPRDGSGNLCEGKTPCLASAFKLEAGKTCLGLQFYEASEQDGRGSIAILELKHPPVCSRVF